MLGVGPEKGPLCVASRRTAERRIERRHGATRCGCGVVDNSPPENQWLSGEVWGPLLGPLCGAMRRGAQRNAAWRGDVVAQDLHLADAQVISPPAVAPFSRSVSTAGADAAHPEQMQQ
jgi:hypothetical protein